MHNPVLRKKIVGKHGVTCFLHSRTVWEKWDWKTFLLNIGEFLTWALWVTKKFTSMELEIEIETKFISYNFIHDSPAKKAFSGSK